MAIRPRRSALYMPGSNARALEKAKTLAADVVIFDLEDAVAPEAKDAAREQVMAAVTGGGYGSRELVVRINGLDTPWGADDLALAAAAAPTRSWYRRSPVPRSSRRSVRGSRERLRGSAYGP